MTKIVYCLKRKKSTGELHLFEATPVPETNKCTPKTTSCCGNIKRSECDENVFSCLDENEARLRCAKEGRDVCGPCVSHLYTTYDD